MKQTNQETKLLPVVELDGTDYLVDIDKRQFRNFRNTDDVIGMHSQQGREMVKAMMGTQWRTFAAADDLIWGQQRALEV